MSIIETRLANLELLAAQHRFGKAFCDAAGISPSYLSQLRSGTKTLGNVLARQIEQRMNLEAGFLDVDRSAQAAEHAGLPADVMSAAYALQGMDSGVRYAFMRLILAVAASALPAAVPARTALAETFEFESPTEPAREAQQRRPPARRTTR